MIEELEFKIRDKLVQKLERLPVGYSSFYDGEEVFVEVVDSDYGQIKIWTMGQVEAL